VGEQAGDPPQAGGAGGEQTELADALAAGALL